jgi:hypothetical protein
MVQRRTPSSPFGVGGDIGGPKPSSPLPHFLLHPHPTLPLSSRLSTLPSPLHHLDQYQYQYFVLVLTLERQRCALRTSATTQVLSHLYFLLLPPCPNSNPPTPRPKPQVPKTPIPKPQIQVHFTINMGLITSPEHHALTSYTLLKPKTLT